MTFLRRIFGISPRPKTSSDAKSRSGAVTRTASAAVKKYEKTFSDLAKYDRGERLNHPLRTEVEIGIRELDAGLGEELRMSDVIRQAREEYGCR
jgi:hypothetical protein